MNLTPITTKTETKIAKVARVITRQLDNVSGFLRRDGLNAVESPAPVVKEAQKTVYCSPTTPIIEPIAPKNCASEIDFRF